MKFLIVFGLIWAGVTVAADYFVVNGLLRQIDASNRFTPVQGIVLSSTIKVSSDDDGTSYTPTIEYSYSAGARSLHGNRYCFGMTPASHSFASRVVNEHPAGSPITIYCDPSDPAVSLIDNQVRGWHVFMFLFLAPFNAVLLCGSAAAFDRLRRAPRPAGDTLIDDDGRIAILRPEYVSPSFAGCAAFGLGGFVLSFASFLVPSISSSVTGALCAIASSFAFGLWIAFGVAKRRRRGDYDLVLDRSLRRLRLPARTALLAGTPEVSFDHLDQATVEPETITDSDGSSTKYHVRLFAHWAGVSRPVTLATWSDATRAEALTAWLRHELNLEGKTSNLRRSA